MKTDAGRADGPAGAQGKVQPGGRPEADPSGGSARPSDAVATHNTRVWGGGEEEDQGWEREGRGAGHYDQRC